MKRVLITAALVAATLAPAAFAQSAYDPYPTDPAQLQREHQRALKAGDSANDPFNSSSSDQLNRQQAQAAQGASPIVWPSQSQTGQGQTGMMGDQYVAPDPGSVGDQYVSPNTCITPPQAVPPGAPQPPVCDSATAPSGTPPQNGTQVW